jgi:SAM-dependent methyltransferase
LRRQEERWLRLIKHEKIKIMIRQDVPYTIQNNALCFLQGDHKPWRSSGKSLLGRIQDILKHNGSSYYFLKGLFKPVWKSRKCRQLMTGLLHQYGQKAVILNLGSGPRILQRRKDIINVDLFAFDEVDMVSDAEDMPLKNDTVDLVLSLAMLEHVVHPERMVREMYRLLRPGGEAFCYVPFLVPFHAAPHDFYRWTMSGVRTLFQDYEQVEVGIGAGPTSAMLWVMQEWLSILLSFGSRRLHDIILLGLMVLTAPFKIMDTFLVWHPQAAKISSGFYILAKKG